MGRVRPHPSCPTARQREAHRAAAETVTTLVVWLGSSQYRLARLPDSDDCSPSLPGSSGNDALANVTSDRALHDNAPFRYAQRAMSRPDSSTADKYSNLSAQHRPHTTAADP
jgi:hypothetical protein